MPYCLVHRRCLRSVNFISLRPALVPSFSCIRSLLCFHAGPLCAAPLGSSLPHCAGLVAPASGEREPCHVASLSMSRGLSLHVSFWCLLWSVVSGENCSSRQGSLFRFLLPSLEDNKGQTQGEPLNRHFREALVPHAHAP